MTWTAERKRAVAVRAPLDPPMLRPDSRVVRRPGWYQLITPSAPGTLLNEVILSRVAPAEAERCIDDVVATYRATGHPVKWCVGPWTEPADFGDRLARRGFRSWDVRGMAIATSRQVAAPDAVSVVEVGEHELHAYLTTSMRGWSIPTEQRTAELELHRAALRASPRLARFFAALVNGDTVGTTGLFLKEGHAYLVGAQVLPAFRGRGVYRALVAARLAFLARAGVELAVTHAREATSAPVLEHLGFETLFRSACYLLEPARTTRPGRTGTRA
ncbi:MAG: GNAT family N-acetyltransferase [Sandaracinaceae bacterium]